ncbi:MAG: YihY family inner membrane protein, partial [Rubrivivax sp.]|nr:YihY family inner membrane protein [Rubrivivax sp.]
AKGFGFDKTLEEQLMQRIQGQEEALSVIIEFAHRLLETTRGGLVAGVGVIVLFWSILKVFGNIEETFNELWSVPRARSLLRKTTDYLAVSFFCPILLITSSALTVLVTSEVTFFVQQVRGLEAVSPAIFFGLKLLPMGALWILFTLLYAVIPNTRVKMSSALFAGVAAGTAFQVFQRIYIVFQIGVAKYNAIYGSFAALPLFLVWLQTSWLIVLAGGQLSFACQNADHWKGTRLYERLSPAARRLIALTVAHLTVKNFTGTAAPLRDVEIAARTELPAGLVQKALDQLVQAGIVSEVRLPDHREPGYQPALDPAAITIGRVIEALDHCGVEELPPPEWESHERLSRSLESMASAMLETPENRLLKDI